MSVEGDRGSVLIIRSTEPQHRAKVVELKAWLCLHWDRCVILVPSASTMGNGQTLQVYSD
jgi:hypothetical protein